MACAMAAVFHQAQGVLEWWGKKCSNGDLLVTTSLRGNTFHTHPQLTRFLHRGHVCAHTSHTHTQVPHVIRPPFLRPPTGTGRAHRTWLIRSHCSMHAPWYRCRQGNWINASPRSNSHKQIVHVVCCSGSAFGVAAAHPTSAAETAAARSSPAPPIPAPLSSGEGVAENLKCGKRATTAVGTPACGSCRCRGAPISTPAACWCCCSIIEYIQSLRRA